MTKPSFRILPFLLALLVGFSSCVSHRELVNFNEADLTAQASERIKNSLELLVQPDDLLRITVHSLDPEAAAPFNLENPTANGGGGGGQGLNDPTTLELFRGYLVDREGNIDFPLLGTIPVEGKTLEAVKLDIRNRLAKYLKDPVVNARYLNFKVTVLGEVRTPGVVRLTNSRTTLLDVLGQAGDLSDYADRSNILIVREDGHTRQYVNINLHEDDIFDSPYFYLKQNDLVYVSPIRAKTAVVADPAQRAISYVTAALSITGLIIALSTRN